MLCHTINATTLANVPHRRSRKDLVVLKFGGTTVGATPQQARIRLARIEIADLLAKGKYVVPVFSALRRGRNGAHDKFSVTDFLQNYTRFVHQHDTIDEGLERFERTLYDVHMQLVSELGLQHNRELRDDIVSEINGIRKLAGFCCSAFEDTPSQNDVIVTAGERLAVKIVSAYLNRKHAEGKFPLPTVPVSAMELGIFTDCRFGAATIEWARAVDHTREVIGGHYLDRGLMPIVTGFDGIYDPDLAHGASPSHEQGRSGQRSERTHRTSLGRGGSDLTATFLGLALSAEYVGFCKETPGVLTGDDLLLGPTATTIKHLDYDLATEAGNIYSLAVEPVRAGNVPVHIYDPADPTQRTIVSDDEAPKGLHIIERPIQTVNLHVGNIPDEPGSLAVLLDVIAQSQINVEEVRHQRSGTDCILRASLEQIHSLVSELNHRGMRPRAHVTWYLRVIGNVTDELAGTFNEFMRQFEPLTLGSYQVGAKVLTATLPRNRVGCEQDETRRMEAIVRCIHDTLIAPLHAVSAEPLPDDAIHGEANQNHLAHHRVPKRECV